MTTKIATGRSASNLLSSSLIALKPPAEAPITMIFLAVSWFRDFKQRDRSWLLYDFFTDKRQRRIRQYMTGKVMQAAVRFQLQPGLQIIVDQDIDDVIISLDQTGQFAPRITDGQKVAA
jgi:hypothetical protein